MVEINLTISVLLNLHVLPDFQSLVDYNSLLCPWQHNCKLCQKNSCMVTYIAACLALTVLWTVGPHVYRGTEHASVHKGFVHQNAQLEKEIGREQERERDVSIRTVTFWCLKGRSLPPLGNEVSHVPFPTVDEARATAWHLESRWMTRWRTEIQPERVGNRE